MRFFIALLVLFSSVNAFANAEVSMRKGEYKGSGLVKDHTGKTQQYDVVITIVSHPGIFLVTNVTTINGKPQKWAFQLRDAGKDFYKMMTETGDRQIGEGACLGSQCEFYIPGGSAGFRQESYKFNEGDLTVAGMQTNAGQKQIWRETLFKVR